MLADGSAVVLEGRRALKPRPQSLAVLVVSWNGRAHLEHLLPALADQRDPGCAWRILLFDNGSTDGTVGWVRERYPQIEILEGARNLGFAAANNRLAERAESDLLVLVNNDMRPRPDWLAALVDAYAAAAPEVTAISGLIVDWDERHLDFGRGIRTFDGHAFQLDARRPLDRARIPQSGELVPFACGGNMLIERRAFLEAGAFDASFFAYLEDVDLGWRLWAGGERAQFCREAVVAHRASATSERLGVFHRGFLFERNALLTAYKNYDRELWPKLMPAVLLTFLARVETLLVEGNPSAGLLRRDPVGGAPAGAAEVAKARMSTGGAPEGDLLAKWRRHGSREMARRARRKVAREARRLFADRTGERVDLDHPQAIAHLRALSLFRATLDQAAGRRAEALARRRVPDRELVERFPLYLVATYPGDERLFSSAGFASFLPESPRLERARLEEIQAE